MIASLGLGLIVVGWVIQLIEVCKKKKRLNRIFVIMYVIGVALLVADGFMNGLMTLAFLNLVCLVVVALVLVKIKA